MPEGWQDVRMDSGAILAQQALLRYTPEAKVATPSYGLTPSYAIPGVPVAPLGNEPGQCPLVNGQPDPLVRECDPYTGIRHFEYALPSGIPANANILVAQPSGKYDYIGPSGTQLITRDITMPANQRQGGVTTNVVQGNQLPTVIPSGQSETRNPVTTVVRSVSDYVNQLFRPSDPNLVEHNYTYAPDANRVFSALESTVPVGNFDIPIWAFGLVAIGGMAWFAGSNKGGRR